MEKELRKHAAKLRALADNLAAYAPLAAQLEALLAKMESPAQRSARQAQQAQNDGKIKAPPNSAGQLPTDQGEFGQKAKPAA